jgi:hypothetical protein
VRRKARFDGNRIGGKCIPYIIDLGFIYDISSPGLTSPTENPDNISEE